MIDAAALLTESRRVADVLVDDLRGRTESDEASRVSVRGVFEQASAAGRTDRSFEEWREDLLAQVAAGWVLACVFVRFCEDNGLVDTPLLSGPGERVGIARDHQAAFFAEHREAGNREWLIEVFGRYQDLPGVSGIFGERNPLWQVAPSADGAKALVELWWATDDDGRHLRHDFTDEELDTRFLGDLYQDLSEHARKQFALLQTPDFIESFILDRTLDPAIETFGLDECRMIDPTCGSGHFLLGAFDRIVHRWQEREPATSTRVLAQRTLNAVNGVDINPFAVAIARFRLLVAALRVSEIRRLQDAPDFHINVATGDSLLHGTHGGRLFAADDLARTVAHHYPTEDVELAEQILQADRYHAVVGNPPYINVSDRALRGAYRSLYPIVHGEYALTVPFFLRFDDLSVKGNSVSDSGFLGQIASKSFATRDMGKKLVEEFLCNRAVSQLIDCEPAFIPGHDGVPTVITFWRPWKPLGGQTQLVLAREAERGIPAVPASGRTWLALVAASRGLAGESDVAHLMSMQLRDLFSHPMVLSSPEERNLYERIDRKRGRLNRFLSGSGMGFKAGLDDAFRLGDSPEVFHPVEATFIEGSSIEDYSARGSRVIFPHFSTGETYRLADSSALSRWLWRTRTSLANRKLFGGRKFKDSDRPWYAWQQYTTARIGTGVIAYRLIATHGTFSLAGQGSQVLNQSVRFVQPLSEKSRDSILGLLGSSVATFLLRQVLHPKGSGGKRGHERWERYFEWDAGRIANLATPGTLPAERFGREIQAAIQDASDCLKRLDRDGFESGRGRMVATQEELDWVCYRLYGLLNEDLSLPLEHVPTLAKGERAFEIALARRMAAGETSSTWFERHGSTPITELPDHWPDAYRQLVERRLQLIEADPAIELMERPEHKRRWNWSSYDNLAVDAQERWLLDRFESYLVVTSPDNPQPTTVARLADRLHADDDARQVADDLAGVGADLTKLVDRLVRSAGVSYLAAHRFKPSGLRKRAVWERTWELQRAEDAIDARAELPANHDDHLDASEVAGAKRDARVDRIAPPPPYARGDFRDATTWTLRGKLDMPKERFVLYPQTRLGADASLVVGWAGWDHLQEARALAAIYTARQQDGAEPAELGRLLAGLWELVPWLKQWHDEPDPTYGERMGQFFAAYVQTETDSLGLTLDDLVGERPLQID